MDQDLRHIQYFVDYHTTLLHTYVLRTYTYRQLNESVLQLALAERELERLREKETHLMSCVENLTKEKLGVEERITDVQFEQEQSTALDGAMVCLFGIIFHFLRRLFSDSRVKGVATGKEHLPGAVSTGNVRESGQIRAVDQRKGS